MLAVRRYLAGNGAPGRPNILLQFITAQSTMEPSDPIHGMHSENPHIEFEFLSSFVQCRRET